MGRLVAELNKDALVGWLYAYANMNFLHFAVFLFVACTAILVLVSLSAPPASDRQLAGLTYATVEAPDGTGRGSGVSDDKRTDWALSLLLVVLVGMIWLYFTG
jgi:SSS family solute:Na+ symporter